MAKTKRQTGHTGRHLQRRAPRALQPAQRVRPSVPSPQRPRPEPRITYSDDLAAAICEHVADGLSLKEACALPGMPSRSAAYKWLAAHTSFVDMYTRAREERADLVADEIITIADTETCPHRARNRIDARKWWAARVNPKKYSDRLITENTNRNHSYVISDKPMTEEEWEAEYGPSGSAWSTGLPH
jgi:terminase small subunit-like protein